jgi:hypothetical protein
MYLNGRRCRASFNTLQSTVRSDRAAGIGEVERLEFVCVRMAIREAPHRGGFVLPNVQRVNAPGRRPLSTRCAQSSPRLACPLYVWKIMQVNDGGRGTAPRASAGRVGDVGSFFAILHFLSDPFTSSERGWEVLFGISHWSIPSSLH